MSRSPNDTLVMDSLPDPSEEIELIRSAIGADYEVIEELGRGGMAVIYRARERALDREVALKVLPLARTFDAELVERFQREARLAASLEHPHIVPIYRVGRSGRINFFAMKYVRGESLADELSERGRLEPQEVERILSEVGEALGHAHKHGVVHRDVKPDNIMKDETGRYVIMDFGIAKSVGGRQLTQEGGSVGTPRYMSPEQAKGGELDGRSDLYSLGVVAYHCLTGRPPFDGDDPLSILYSHLHDPVPEPNLDSEHAMRVYAIIRRLLAKAPADRTPGVQEIRATGPRATPSPLARAPQADPVGWLRGRSKRFWVSAGVLLVVVAVLNRDGAGARCRTALPNASEDDRALLMEPLGTIASGAEIEVSYVACGLPGGEAFTARVTIGPADQGGVVGRVGRLFGGGADPVRVTWDDEADGFATSRIRTIDPGELTPGSYRLTLQIEGSDGRRRETSHDFTVVDG